MSVPSPTQSCRRKVLVYPANGDKPHVQLMDFNEAGADHPYGFYATAVDLRVTYGKYVRQTLVQWLDVTRTEQSEANDHHGEYIIYFNLNLALPLNLSVARLLEINPKLPGARPTWRGDVVAVRHKLSTSEFSARPLLEWLDVAPTIQQEVDRLFIAWYKSKKWANMIEDEKKWADQQKRQESSDMFKLMDSLQTQLDLSKSKHPEILKAKKAANKQKAVADQRRMDKTLDKLERHQEKQTLRAALYKCRSCDIVGADLKICKRCKQARYCDRECQVSDWKRHKKECVEFEVTPGRE